MIALPVEDEPLIAMLAGGIFRDLDYPVFEARTKGEPFRLRDLLRERGRRQIDRHADIGALRSG